MGYILRKQHKLAEAAAHCQRAIALRPDFAEAHNNLGRILRSQGRLEEALACFEQATALRPNFAEAHCSLGNVLASLARLDEAEARFQQALALRPDLAEAEFGLAICWLTKGDYQRGWPAYEARRRLPSAKPLPPVPRWQGEPLSGRSLLLIAEQGLGDTFQFVRFVRLLKTRGARVVLAAQPAAVPLLKSYPDMDELVILGSEEPLPPADYCLPLLSLPGVLRTDTASIPAEIPYLRANPELAERWRQELSRIDGFKIGIAWHGHCESSGYRTRSTPLAEFAPLAGLSGVLLISLQKGEGAEQVAGVNFPVLDFSNRLDEQSGRFMDTAALIANLDLVVTVDTSIAHLAGAFGAPALVALHRVADWRWLRGRDDSPWYPTLRLFRQTVFGQWSDVFERIAQAVQARLPSRSPQDAS